MFNLPVSTLAGTSNAGTAPASPPVVSTAEGQVSVAAESRLVPAAAVAPAPEPSRNQVQAAMESVKKMVDSTSSNSLQFSIDDDTGKTLVRVTDIKTGELIRQIPSKELVEIAKSLDRLQGLLLRQKA